MSAPHYLGVWDTLWYYLVLPCTSSDSYSLAEAFYPDKPPTVFTLTREETGGTRLKGLHRLRGMGWAVIGIAYALVPNMGNVGRMGGGVLHENKIIKNNHSCSAAGDGVAIDSKSESAMGSYTSEL